MKALVIYNSMYGNTEQIARAIGHALGSEQEVEILRVGDVKPGKLAGFAAINGRLAHPAVQVDSPHDPKDLLSMEFLKMA